MTNQPLVPPATPPVDRPSIRSRWPVWAGYGAAAWSAIYGLLGLYWAFGGAGFPFGVEHDKDARWISLLEHSHPETTGPVIAVVGLGGAALAMTMSRQRPRGSRGTVPAAFAWVMAAGLAVVIPDYRPLLAVVRAPMLLIGAPFGWPAQVKLADFVVLFLPWPVANQILLILGGLLWALTAVAYRRRVRDARAHRGRTDTAPGWTTPASAARWGRYAAYVAVVIPAGYALTRWSWALDIPLGVTREGLHNEARDSPGIWLAGALLATMGAGGALLTLGLVQRWGEVYPRWIPYLRGKPVRPRTAIVPASLVAILVTSAGLMYVRWLILGRFRLTGETWGLVLPELFWPLWGAALGAAALAYHLRRRGGPHSSKRS
jgi:hypothetical protein